jgi:hypothetical protein
VSSQVYRTSILKWVVIVLLGLMLSGAAAMVYWAPVHAYGITCSKAQQISCAIDRETAGGVNSWQVPLGAQTHAAVRVEPQRRGSARVFLYLESPAQAVFAAEFEGSAAVSEAESACAQLNRVFSSTSPTSARIEVRPPSYLRWMAWGGIGFLGLLVLAVYRELCEPERSASDACTPTPGNGRA